MPKGIYPRIPGIYPKTPRTEESNRKRSDALRTLTYDFRGPKVQDGYIRIYRPTHPRADDKGYVKRADLVLEEMLGRPLTKEEIVDHKNRVRDDDNPGNLQLFPNTSEHSKYHSESGHLFKRGTFIRTPEMNQRMSEIMKRSWRNQYGSYRGSN